MKCDSNLESIHDNSASKLPHFPLRQVIHVCDESHRDLRVLWIHLATSSADNPCQQE